MTGPALRERLEVLRMQAEVRAVRLDATDRERAEWSAAADVLAGALATQAPEGMEAIDRLFAVMRALYAEHMLARINRSWPLVDREEQQARLRTVTELAIELDRIRRVDLFSTQLAASLLEDAIDGDWQHMRSAAAWFRFAEEGPDVVTKYAPLWARFVEIAETEALLAEHRARSVGRAPS